MENSDLRAGSVNRCRHGAVMLLAWWGIFLLAGCATINYDPQADKSLSTITHEINQQLIVWQHQAGTKQYPKPVRYDPKFYDHVEADIATLEIRMEATQDFATQKVVGIFKSLNEQLEGMRDIHKKQNNLTASYLHAERLILNEQLAVLTTFELSLKNSQKTSNGKTTSTATRTAKKAAKRSL